MKIRSHGGSLVVLWSFAWLLAMQLTASAQTLTHRYSFFSEADGATNAVDTVGAANGTLFRDAAISGAQLKLDGNAYVQLPVGIITNDLAVTIEAWGDYPSSGQGTSANLFDFGAPSVNDLPGKADSHSISFCVNTAGTGQCDAAISDTDDANVVRQNCFLTSVGEPYPLAGQTGEYVAAVFNPPGGYIEIYTNGLLAARLTGVTSTVTPGVWDVSNLIGADNWPDPPLTANLDEFRIWNGALTPDQIADDYALGPNQLSTAGRAISLSASISAGSLVISWPVTGSGGLNLFSSPRIGPGAVWTQVTTTPTVVGGNNQVSMAITRGGTQFYQLKN